jgi:hypothetical protein
VERKFLFSVWNIRGVAIYLKGVFLPEAGSSSQSGLEETGLRKIRLAGAVLHLALGPGNHLWG